MDNYSEEEKRRAIRRVASQKRVKTAGEVRFIKDRGDDSTAWAWGQHPPQERVMDSNHVFNPKCAKDIARVLRSSLSALGHAMSAYTVFAKIKSRDISPDGNLGGRGYIMDIKSMRRQYMNIVEALSALSDTLYDEISEDHWARAQEKIVERILNDAEEIRDDPEEWARDREESKDKAKDKDAPLERDYHSPRKKIEVQR